jgi:hypothetical protein
MLNPGCDLGRMCAVSARRCEEIYRFLPWLAGTRQTMTREGVLLSFVEFKEGSTCRRQEQAKPPDP